MPEFILKKIKRLYCIREGFDLSAIVTMAEFTFEVRDKTITITGLRKRAREVVIPARINDIPVTHIGDRAFEQSQLTSVSIPNSVTHIGILAFAWNPLTTLTISDSITSIGGWAFAGSQLASIIIPNTVTHIGNRAFIGGLLISITFGRAGTITGKDFIDNEGNLKALYSSGGAGTYTRSNANSANWTQQ